MKICIDNSDSKYDNDEYSRDGYTALCQDCKEYYGTEDFNQKLEIKEGF